MPFRYKKQFGQHFLRQVPKELLFPIDALEKIQSLQIPAKIQIFEIGPGGGIVTEAVVKQLLSFQKLSISYTVIDIDAEAIEATKERLGAMDLPKRISVTYAHEDVLKYHFPLDTKTEFLFIFGSLPYNISKKIVNDTKQISSQLNDYTCHLPSRFMLQAEVAEDYVADPPKATYLGTELSLWANKRKILRKFPPGAFVPPPAVDSAILEVEWRQKKELPDITQLIAMSKFLRTGFTARRKVVGSIYKKLIPPEKLTPTVIHLLSLRPHELSMGEWLLIKEMMSNNE